MYCRSAPVAASIFRNAISRRLSVLTHSAIARPMACLAASSSCFSEAGPVGRLGCRPRHEVGCGLDPALLRVPQLIPIPLRCAPPIRQVAWHTVPVVLPPAALITSAAKDTPPARATATSEVPSIELPPPDGSRRRSPPGAGRSGLRRRRGRQTAESGSEPRR